LSDVTDRLTGRQADIDSNAFLFTSVLGLKLLKSISIKFGITGVTLKCVR